MKRRNSSSTKDGKNKQQPVHYVGRVQEELDDDHLNVSYFRNPDVPAGVQFQNMLAFKKPFKEDKFPTLQKHILTKLRLKDTTKYLTLFEKSEFKGLLVR